MNMVNKLLEIYYKKQSISRSNHLEKLSQKKSVIFEEQDVKYTSDLSFYYDEPKTTQPTLQIPEFENAEFNKLEKLNFENERLIENQKETIKKQDEKLVNQFSYISDLEEIMENYKKDIDTIEKEFVELKKSISHQNNLFIKPNSKKIKIFGIPIYSVEY